MKKILLVTTIFLVVWFGYRQYISKLDRLDEDDFVPTEAKSDPVEVELEKIRAKGGVTFKAKSNKSLKAIESMDYKELYREVISIKAELVAKDDVCEKAADKLFPNDNLIDINDKFYNKQDWVIERLHDTFSKTMIKVEADELYSLLHTMVQNKQPIKAKKVFDLVNDSSVCRPMKSLSFLDSVSEAYVKKGWGDPMRQELAYVYLTMANHLLGENYSTKNMSEVLSLLATLAERKIFPHESKDELSRLFMRLKDQEKVFRTAFRPENEEEANYNALADDMERKRELAQELRELMKRYKGQYAPDFE